MSQAARCIVRIPEEGGVLKSTVDQIRQRFDADVERFSNLETGQSATIDAPLVLDLIAETAHVANPDARSLLDIGSGAGSVDARQGDIRELSLDEAQFDVIVAAAVFHHLRGDDEWQAVFRKLYA